MPYCYCKGTKKGRRTLRSPSLFYGVRMWPYGFALPLAYSGFNLVDYSLEGVGIVDGQVGQHLAVYLYAGFVQGSHQC